jgi:flagellar protein FlaH
MDNGKYLNIALRTDELHRRLGTGIPKESLVLIEGEDGAGKSIVCQRLLYGFLTNGHSVTYVSSELTTKDFLNQMNSIRYGVGPYMRQKKLLFIPMFPQVGRVVPRTDFLDRLMAAKELFSNEAIFIDTLNSLILEKFTKVDLFNLISFLKKITNMDKSVFITVDPSLFDPNALNILRSVSDVHFKLNLKQIEGDMKRSITVNRFRGSTRQISQAIGFRVEPKIGFVMEISAIA